MKEFFYDYTDCDSSNITYAGKKCFEVLKADIDANCACTIQVNLTETFDVSILLHFIIFNYHIDHNVLINTIIDFRAMSISTMD